MNFNLNSNEGFVIDPSLQELFIMNKAPLNSGHGDKGSSHSYIDVYANLFKSFRNKKMNVLEIGIFYGLSLKMWKEYFKNSEIYGIDLTDIYVNRLFPKRNFHVILGDSSKEDILNKIQNINFDIIIDDGCHDIENQLKTFEIFKNKINKNGIYIIEDVLDLDKDREKLESLHDNCEIFDLRNIKDNECDVLAVYRF